MIDPMSSYPGYLLRRASALSMARLAKRLKVLDLNPTEATVLRVIHANPGTKQADIGRLLAIARANMTPLISRLAVRDLIERRPVDGRSYALQASRRGAALAQRVKAVFEAHEAHFLAKLASAERRCLVLALRAVLQDPSD